MNAPSDPSEPFRIAVLISGGGTTLGNLLQSIGQGRLAVEVALVISSSASAPGLRYAADAGIDSRVIPRDENQSPEAFSQAIFSPCRQARVDLVVMGGFLKHVLIPSDFENRVINIHPGLIPAFCGKGYYGLRVHRAVIDYGVKISGCTIHFVDNQYDHGPIIMQRSVEVAEDDTPESLAARVFAAECDAYPQAISLIASDRVKVDGRRIRLC